MLRSHKFLWSLCMSPCARTIYDLSRWSDKSRKARKTIKICSRRASPSCPTTRASHAFRSWTRGRAHPRGREIVKYRRTTCSNCGDIGNPTAHKECAKIADRLAQSWRLNPTYNWRLNVAIRIRTIFHTHASRALNTRARKVGEFKLPHNGKGIIPFAAIL